MYGLQVIVTPLSDDDALFIRIPDDIQCVHWWLIEPPQGMYSIGVCKKCGEFNVFRNTPVEMLKYKGSDDEL